MFSCAVRSMRIVDKEQNKENLKVGTAKKKKQQPFVLYFFTGKTRIFLADAGQDAAAPYFI